LRKTRQSPIAGRSRKTGKSFGRKPFVPRGQLRRRGRLSSALRTWLIRGAGWLFALAVGAFILAILAWATGVWHPGSEPAAVAPDSESAGLVGREVTPLRPPPGEPAWTRNAAAVPVDAQGRPRVVVVIDDLGLDRAALRRILDLPAPLTLAFLPYASDLQRQTARARRAGHELLVHLPMAANGNGSDPGPMALEAGLDAPEFDRRLRWNLARFPGFVGINNHMGSRLTQDSARMRRMMWVFAERGLLFLDSRTTAETVAEEEAARAGVPHAARDVFLDNDSSAEAVAGQLAKLEAVAQETGMAIGIGHPRDETLDALARWLPRLEAKGLTLVPLSAVVSVPDRPAGASSADGW